MTKVTTDKDALFERQPTIDVFGDSGAVRIVTVLIEAGGLPLTVSDIADKANIQKKTVYNNLETLMKYGLVTKSGKSGNAMTYRVELDAEVIQSFTQLTDAMIDEMEYE